MKKLLLIFLSVLCVGAAGCSGDNPSRESSAESSSQLSVPSPTEKTEESSQESTEEDKLPDGVKRTDDNTLSYQSKSKIISSSFPDSFSANGEEKPKDGISLQTIDGKATLKLEFIENPGITTEDLTSFLQETYPDFRLSADDNGIIECKGTLTDSTKKQSCAYLKAKIKDNGYVMALMCFHEGDQKKYEELFNKTAIS